MKSIVPLAAGLLILNVPPSVQAGGCYPAAIKQAVVYQQVIPTYTLYFVGQPIREQALQQKTVTADPLWREFQEFKAWREQYNAQLPVVQAIQSTVLHSTCVKCHSGDEPKGDLRLDGDLTDALKLRAMAKVWRGEMPPTAPLANDKAAELFEELLGSKEPEELPPNPEESR